MGANNSYEKKNDVDAEIVDLFDDLQSYLNTPHTTNPVATIQGTLPVLTLDTLDTEQLRLLKKSIGGESIIKLKTSLDLFTLENNDMIQHNIRIVKNKIEKKKYTNKVLLIFIIVFIVIIAILALFVYIKIVN